MNLKIFIAPFVNRVHLVTILVVAMLFGVFRLSGGGIDVKSKQVARERPTRGIEAATREAPPAELDEMLAAEDAADMFNPQAQVRRLTGDSPEGRPAAPAKPPSRSAIDSTGSLDDLVDVRGVGEAPPQRPKNAGGLNDIEKLVGLR
jgi:hypothetical protein